MSRALVNVDHSPRAVGIHGALCATFSIKARLVNRDFALKKHAIQDEFQEGGNFIFNRDFALKKRAIQDEF